MPPRSPAVRCGPSPAAPIVTRTPPGTGILDVARDYFGPQVTAAGVVRSSTYNGQIGGVPGTDLHVVMNGNPYWDDDAGTNPADQTDPAGSVCEAEDPRREGD